LALSLFAAEAHGQLTVSLTASDGSGASSFNSAGRWSNGQAPSNAFVYSVSGGNGLRSPNASNTINYTFGGASLSIYGGGSQFLMKGNGTTLSTAQSCTANYNLNGGYIEINTAANVWEVVAGTISVNATSALGANSGQNLWVSAAISGSSPLQINFGGGADMASGNTGNVYLAGSNSGFSGSTTVESGTLALASSNALGTGTLYFNGGALLFSPTLGVTSFQLGSLSDGTTSRNISLQNTSGGSINLAIGSNNTNTTYSGAFSGSGSITKQGAGILTLLGASSYTGGTVVINGTLQLGTATALGSGTGTMFVNGGILDLNGNSPTTGAVTLASGSIINSGAAAALNASAYSLQSGTVGAVLGGNGATLNMTTAGLAVLSAANTYSGLTTISAGTLALGAAGTLGSGGLTIVPGGVLDTTAYGGSGYNHSGGALTAGRTASFDNDINGSININNTSIILPSTNSTLTISGSLGGSGGTLNYGVGDVVAVGAMNLSGTDYVAPLAPMSTGTYTIFTYNSGTPNLNDLAVSGAYGSNPRQGYTFATSGGSAVTLTVSGVAGNLEWNGAGGNFWYTGTSSTANWYNTTSGSADYFYAGDNVTFDNAGLQTNVSVSGTVNPGSVTVTGSQSYTLSGPGNITGVTSVLMNGTSTLTIANTGGNDYTGGTFVNSGTVGVGANNALPIAGTVSLGTTGSNGTLDLAGNNQTVSGLSVGSGATPAAQVIGNSSTSSNSLLTVSGGTSTFGGTIQNALGSGNQTVGLTLSNSADLTLTGPNTFSGASTINGTSTLQIGNGGAGEAFAASVTDNGTLIFNHADALTYSGAISGSGTLTQQGTSLLTLVSPLNLTGATTVNSGTLDLAGNSGSVGALLGNGVVDNVSAGGLATLTVGSGALSGTFSGTLQNTSGTIGLVKTGAGSETLSGVNTFAGGVSLNAGTLVIGNSAALGSGTLVMNGGTLQGILGVSNSPAINNNIQISSVVGSAFDTSNGNNLALGGNLSGAGTVTKTGSLSVYLSGANSGFSGTYINNAGNTLFDSLAAGSPNALWTIKGGNLANNVPSGGTISLGGLSGSGGQLGNSASGSLVTYSIGAASGNTTYSGAIVNSVGGGGTTAIIKTGTGLLTLTGISTYTGTTTITGGTLQLNTNNGGNGQLASPALVVNNGGFLALNAGDVLGFTTNRDVLYISDGTVSNITAAGRVTLQNAVNMTGGVLTGSGNGDVNGVYSFNSTNGFKATSDAGGNPAIVSAKSISLQNGNLNFNVTRGDAAPASDLTVNSAIIEYANNTNGIILNGNGVMTLAGSNTYTGKTTITGGTLAIAGTSSLPATSALQVGTAGNPGTLVFQGTSVTNLADTGDNNYLISFGSTVYVLPGAQFTSAGDWKLGGNAPGSAGSQVQSGGTFTINDSSSGRPLTIGEWPNETSTYTLNGGVLNVPNGITYAPWDGEANFTIVGGTANLQEISIGRSGGLAGGGTLTVAGSGLLNLGAGGIANNYGPATVNLNAGVLGAYQSWSSAVAMNVGGPVTIAPSGFTISLSGALTGTGSLTEVGSGTLVLAQSNSYSGGTFINGGLLQLGNSAALGSGALAANGGTLDLNGFAVTVPSFSGAAGIVTNSGGFLATLATSQSTTTTFGGTIADGASPVALALTGAGALVLSGTNTYSGGTFLDNGTLIATNAGAIADGTSLTVGDASAFPAAIVAPSEPSTSASPVIAPVPEPGALALLSTGLLLLVSHRKRSRIA
jgi:autotransporter-associated beta strand protein